MSCGRSVVFSGYSGFPPLIKLPGCNWNIVESGDKHPNPNPLTCLWSLASANAFVKALGWLLKLTLLRPPASEWIIKWCLFCGDFAGLLPGHGFIGGMTTRCCWVYGEENGADLGAGLLLAGCNRKIMAKCTLKCFSEDINNLYSDTCLYDNRFVLTIRLWFEVDHCLPIMSFAGLLLLNK